MSIKTLRKRIALVAVAALAVTGLSTVAANAATTWSDGDQKYAAGTQIAGGEYDAVLEHDGDANTVYNITVTGGTIVAVDTTCDSAVERNGLNWSDGVRAVCDDTETVTISITRSTAGSVSLSAQPLVAGVPGTAISGTVTFLAAASTAISSANTRLTLVDTAADCVSDATSSTEAAALAANAGDGSMSYRDTSANDFLCLIVRDGNNSRVAFDDLDAVVFGISAGSLEAGAIGRVKTKADADLEVGEDYAASLPIVGDTLAAAKAAIQVTIIEGTTTITKTLSYDFYGKIKTVSLTPVTSSVNAGVGGLDYLDAEDKADATLAVTVECKDALGLVVTYCDYDGDGNHGEDSGDNIFTVIDTSLAAGSPTFIATAPDDATEAGAPVFTYNQNGNASVVNEYEEYIEVDVSSATLKAQKITVTIYVRDATDTVNEAATISATANFYVAGAVDKISVTVADNKVNVNVVDANGYPVADGTEVAMAASNGSVTAPSLKTTFDGKFVTAATFIPSSTSATSTVTAIVGSKSGTSSPVAGTGVTTDTTIASLVAAIAKLQKAIAKINKRLKR